MTSPDPQRPARLTGTEERPIELIPAEPSTRRDWAVLLGGPVTWFVHFMVVYLVAQAACESAETPDMRFIGTSALSVGVVVATVVAGAVCLAIARVAHVRTRRDRRETIDLATIGLLLAVGSFAAVLAVGVPALVLEPC